MVFIVGLLEDCEPPKDIEFIISIADWKSLAIGVAGASAIS